MKDREDIDRDAQGNPVVAGTTMKVVELVMAQRAHGWSVEEFHFQHPHLSLSQINAALTCYWDNQQELDAEIEKRSHFAEEARREAGPSPLAEKIRLNRLLGAPASLPAIQSKTE